MQDNFEILVRRGVSTISGSSCHKIQRPQIRLRIRFRFRQFGLLCRFTAGPFTYPKFVRACSNKVDTRQVVNQAARLANEQFRTYLLFQLFDRSGVSGGWAIKSFSARFPSKISSLLQRHQNSASV